MNESPKNKLGIYSTHYLVVQHFMKVFQNVIFCWLKHCLGTLCTHTESSLLLDGMGYLMCWLTCGQRLTQMSSACIWPNSPSPLCSVSQSITPRAAWCLWWIILLVLGSTYLPQHWHPARGASPNISVGADVVPKSRLPFCIQPEIKFLLHLQGLKQCFVHLQWYESLTTLLVWLLSNNNLPHCF